MTTELRPEQLHHLCAAEDLGIETTETVAPLAGVLGQQDSVDALAFGVGIARFGYNIFVIGEPNSGRVTLVKSVLRETAAAQPTPPDYCYVFNFEDPRRPRALALPAGRAVKFRDELDRLLAELREAIPQALTADMVVARRTAILEEHQKPAAAALDDLRRDLKEDPYVAFIGSENAMMIVPARDGEPIGRDAYDHLPEEERNRTDQHVRDATTTLMTTQRKVQDELQEARRQIADMNREAAANVVRQRIALLDEKYADLEPVKTHLKSMAEDMVQHADDFAAGPQTEGSEEAAALLGAVREDFFKRYTINVLVSRAPDAGAPVIEESHPHLRNLLGRMEQHVRFGAMTTDFRHIAPGALHRANGGYLILEAKDLLMQPLVWPALKRVVRTGQLKPAEIAAEIGLFAGESLEPEAIPVDLKIVLIGEPGLYYLLAAVDPELGELFKIKVDFRPQMERNRETEYGYAQLVAASCQRLSLPPFEAGAVAMLIEEGSRMAGDQKKLTTRLGDIVDLIGEAAQWASLNGNGRVHAADVERALSERDRRNNRPQRELLDLIERGILAFEPFGDSIGQLHGIGLIGIGSVFFGRPIRVIASAFLGTGGVINIEREAKLSGRIHSKGFLVLSGYLGSRFARAFPLVLSASLSFDQMYEEVEGDSASAAELYALLSAIGRVPLRQGIAVTGAVNQDGVVLPVGGVTEKVEGFFKACERKGLTGEQGVILPQRNHDALVVRREVREAVAADRFHIWAIDRVEDAWPLLAGRDAGEMTPEDTFPEGTVHHAVFDRLHSWADEWKRFAEAAPHTPDRALQGST